MREAVLRSAPDAVRPAAIPLRELVPWLIFGCVLGLVLMYLVGLDQGAISLIPGRFVHELVHDPRHLLGFPCH